MAEKKDHLKKVPYTLRLEKYLVDRLDELSQKSSKAAVARDYLNLTNYLSVRPDLSIEMPDGTPAMVIPKSTMQDIFYGYNRDKQLEIGNELGRIFNTNCSIRQYTTIADKITYLQSIGWFDIKLVPRKRDVPKKSDDPKEKEDPKKREMRNFMYYGILAKYWPIHLLHAFFYRILHNHQFPFEWDIMGFKEFLDMDPEKFEKEKKKLVRTEQVFKDKDTRNMIEDYKEKIGGHIENFHQDCVYYLFDILSYEETK